MGIKMQGGLDLKSHEDTVIDTVANAMGHSAWGSVSDRPTSFIPRGVLLPSHSIRGWTHPTA